MAFGTIGTFKRAIFLYFVILVPAQCSFQNSYTYSVTCDSSFLTIQFRFSKPFKGVIYADHYKYEPACSFRAPPSSILEATLKIDSSSCGARIRSKHLLGISIAVNIGIQQHDLLKTRSDVFQPVFCEVADVRDEHELYFSKSRKAVKGLSNIASKLEIKRGSAALGTELASKLELSNKYLVVFSLPNNGIIKDIKVKNCILHENMVLDKSSFLYQITHPSGCQNTSTPMISAFKVVNSTETGNLIAYAQMKSVTADKTYLLSCGAQFCKRICKRKCPRKSKSDVITAVATHKISKRSVNGMSDLSTRKPSDAGNRFMKSTIKALSLKFLQQVKAQNKTNFKKFKAQNKPNFEKVKAQNKPNFEQVKVQNETNYEQVKVQNETNKAQNETNFEQVKAQNETNFEQVKAQNETNFEQVEGPNETNFDKQVLHISFNELSQVPADIGIAAYPIRNTDEEFTNTPNDYEISVDGNIDMDQLEKEYNEDSSFQNQSLKSTMKIITAKMEDISKKLNQRETSEQGEVDEGEYENSEEGEESNGYEETSTQVKPTEFEIIHVDLNFTAFRNSSLEPEIQKPELGTEDLKSKNESVGNCSVTLRKSRSVKLDFERSLNGCVPQLTFLIVTIALGFVTFTLILVCCGMVLYIKKEKKRHLIDNFLLYSFY